MPGRRAEASPGEFVGQHALQTGASSRFRAVRAVNLASWG